MMLDRSTRLAALVLLFAGPLPCAAQNAPLPNAPSPNAPSPNAPSPNAPVPQTRDACAGGPRAPSDQSASDQSLSKKLEQTDGVICPPEVDPDIKAPTPQGGRMPIIPPPGSPGGDPSVRPK
jgi:hypothetical protein